MWAKCEEMDVSSIIQVGKMTLRESLNRVSNLHLKQTPSEVGIEWQVAYYKSWTGLTSQAPAQQGLRVGEIGANRIIPSIDSRRFSPPLFFLLLFFG